MQHRTLIHSTVALAVLALAIAGCKAQMVPPAVTAIGTIEGVTVPAAKDGQVRLRLHFPKGSRYAVQAVPTGWAEADVTLYSSSANDAYDASMHRREVAFDDFEAETGTAQLGTELVANLANAPDQMTTVEGMAYIVPTGISRVDKVDLSTGTVTQDYGNYSTLASGFKVFAKDFNYEYTVMPSTKQLQRWSGTTPTVLGGTLPTGTYTDLVSDGNRVFYSYYTTSSAGLQARSVTSGSTVNTAAPGRGPVGISYANDQVALADFKIPTVYTVNTFNNTVTSLFTGIFPTPVTATVTDVAIDGTKYYITDDAKLIIWDTSTSPATQTELTLPAAADSVSIENGKVYLALAGTTPGLYVLSETQTAGATAAKVAFPPLRPADDYTAYVFLKDAQGQLLGALAQANVALKPGANVLDLTVTENTEADKAALQNGTGVSNNTIIWDGPGNNLTATVLTGIANSLPGVAKVEVRLSGACYSESAGSLLASLTTASAWQTYAWNLNTKTATYDPDKVVRDQSGTLTIKAFDSHGAVVGTSAIAIQINTPAAPSGGGIPGGALCGPAFGDFNNDCIPDGGGIILPP